MNRRNMLAWIGLGSLASCTAAPVLAYPAPAHGSIDAASHRFCFAPALADARRAAGMAKRRHAKPYSVTWSEPAQGFTHGAGI